MTYITHSMLYNIGILRLSIGPVNCIGAKSRRGVAWPGLLVKADNVVVEALDAQSHQNGRGGLLAGLSQSRIDTSVLSAYRGSNIKPQARYLNMSPVLLIDFKGEFGFGG